MRAHSTQSTHDPATILLASQNRDGGWGYRPGSSWTEATALATLALGAARPHLDNVNRGLIWLQSAQRADGGWPPHASVAQSTWVTALATCVSGPESLRPARKQAIAWLLHRSGRESSLLEKVRRRLRGVSMESGEGTTGWPWFPGTAAWVTPTSLTVLALVKWAQHEPSREIAERVAQGREFLLARACPDGGWNHGAAKALGYDAPSYPETTGVALLALHGIRSRVVEQGIAAAEHHFVHCKSAQGRSWLALGLLAHGRAPAPGWRDALPCRSAMDAAMLLLAAAAEQGDNAFLESV